MTAVETHIHQAVQSFVDLDRRSPGHTPPGTRHLNEVVSTIHQLSAAIVDAEAEGCARDELLGLLEPVRRIHRRSPLGARLQDWPRGYPGDFETIEYLCGARNRAPDATSYAIEWYALTSAIAQQHRNKVQRQAELIAETLSRPGARLLVLACGSGPDLALAETFAQLPQNTAPEIYLNDADSDALGFALSRLQRFRPFCKPLPGNVITALRHAEGRFDLILAGGLFDYLSDRHCRLVIQVARRALAPGGRFFFTNIRAGNPYRPWIEYCANWQLIERTAESLASLAAGCMPPDRAALEIEPDATGLALMATFSAAE